MSNYRRHVAAQVVERPALFLGLRGAQAAGLSFAGGSLRSGGGRGEAAAGTLLRAFRETPREEAQPPIVFDP